MIFSIKTIKSAMNNKLSYNKNNILKSSYYINEAFNILENDLDIIKDNYKDNIKNLLTDYQNKIITIFSNNANELKTITKGFSNNKEIENKVLNYLSNINGTIDISNINITPTKLTMDFEPEIFLVEISKILKDLDSFIGTINDLSKKDNIYFYKTEDFIKSVLNNSDNSNDINDTVFLDTYEFTSYYSNNRFELTVEEIYCRDLFNTLNYPNKLINESQYIINFFNRLAIRLKEMPCITLSDKYPIVIKSKMMAVVSYKLELIKYILENFDNYCRSFCRDISEIADQNIRIIDLLYKVNQNMNIYTDGDFDKEEEKLFESLYNTYRKTYNDLSELDNLSESVGLIALNEAENAKITVYIQKVFNNITKAWNTFKNKMDDLRKKAVSKFTNKFRQSAEELPEDLQFEVRNLPTLADERFNTVKVMPFNYAEMKGNLDSVKQFVSKYYPNININDDEHFKTALERYLIKDTSTVKVTKQYILEQVIPILETSDNVIEDSAKSDIDTLNKSSDAMSNLTNNSTEGSTTTTTNTNVEVQQNSSIISNKNLNTIIEADGNNDNKKIEIVDDENRTAAVNKKSILKEISIYLTVSSSIVSTKMKLIRQKEVTAFRILAHAFTPPKKNKEQK